MSDDAKYAILNTKKTRKTDMALAALGAEALANDDERRVAMLAWSSYDGKGASNLIVMALAGGGLAASIASALGADGFIPRFLSVICVIVAGTVILQGLIHMSAEGNVMAQAVILHRNSVDTQPVESTQSNIRQSGSLFVFLSLLCAAVLAAVTALAKGTTRR